MTQPHNQPRQNILRYKVSPHNLSPLNKKQRFHRTNPFWAPYQKNPTINTRFRYNTTNTSPKLFSYKHYQQYIETLCNPISTAPSYKFQKIIQHLHKNDPHYSTYKRSLISFFLRNFDKMTQHDLFRVLWLLCLLHSSTISRRTIKKITFHR